MIGPNQIPPQKCVCATLRKATRSITQLYDNALRPSGIRATQFHTLAEIRAAGEATVTELTRLLLMDQTTLTRSLALLERDGLLKIVPKPDGRLKSVRLSKKGEQKLLAALPLWAEVQTRVLETLEAGAWDNLSKQLGQLARESSA